MAFTDASQARLRYLSVPYGYGSRIKTIVALLDAAKKNNAINVEDFGGSTGKKRQVNVWYVPMECEDDGSCSDNICDPADTIAPVTVPFTIDDCVATRPISLSRDDIRLIDGNWNYSGYAITMLDRQVEEIRRKLNDKANTFLVSNVGDFDDGSSSKLISLIDPNTGAVRPAGYDEIVLAIQDAGLNDPFVVGGKDVFALQRALNIGGLNQYGQRIDAMDVPNAYYDAALARAFGDPTHGHIVAFSPEVFKFIPWSENAGMFANAEFSRDILEKSFNAGGTYIHTVLPDNATGLVYDLDIIYDACTKKWNMQLRLPFDIFTLPNALCNEEGVNGIFHFQTCLPAPVECPEVPTT